MAYEIRKYPVQHPLLKNYIKFFWEIHVDYMQLSHTLIPQRNINLRFNLNETSHYKVVNSNAHLLENAYFSGLCDHNTNNVLQLNGQADILGVCFRADGFYPFFKIPVSEFKNQLLGISEAGGKLNTTMIEQLKEANNASERLIILENELLTLLNRYNFSNGNFRVLFNSIKQNDNPIGISQLCQQHNISIRKLERLYNKHVGLTAMTYGTLNRFQNGINQLLKNDYTKLSDIAYSNGYADQMHYIKDFKRYAGSTPKSFIHKNSSILQIGKLT